MSMPNPHVFKYQQRSSFYQGLLPPPQFGKGQPQAHDKKGKLSVLVILRAPHTSTLSPMPFTIQSQIRQDNTKGVCCAFLLVGEQNFHGTALMRFSFSVGDANEPDHLCLGCVQVMATNLLLSAPFYSQGEYKLFSEWRIT